MSSDFVQGNFRSSTAAVYDEDDVFALLGVSSDTSIAWQSSFTVNLVELARKAVAAASASFTKNHNGPSAFSVTKPHLRMVALSASLMT